MMTEKEHKTITGNGKKTAQKTVQERDEKGRFVKGCSAGPGRTKKPEFDIRDIDIKNMDEDDFFEVVNLLTKENMLSTDALTRQRAVQTQLLLDDYNKKRKEQTLYKLTGFQLDALKLIRVASCFGGLRGLQAMSKTCAKCPKFKIRQPRDFGFQMRCGDANHQAVGGAE